MISEVCKIQCSRRCELVLAISYVREKDRILSIAHHLANDSQLSAVELAHRLCQMPSKEALALVKRTLKQAGIVIPEQKEGEYCDEWSRNTPPEL